MIGIDERQAVCILGNATTYNPVHWRERRRFHFLWRGFIPSQRNIFLICDVNITQTLIICGMFF